MNRRERFKRTNRYALYYGTGRTEQLSNFDFVIVEPKGHTQEEVERIQQSGTLVIAYISVAEISPDSSSYSLLKDEDFLHENGQKVMNDNFGTYLLNLRSPRWTGLLHHQIGRYLLHSGFDGVFLDTIGDVERPDLSVQTQTEQLNVAAEFVAQLREYFPNHILIQNNGLETLSHRTLPYIDALLWENPPFLIESSQDWMTWITLQLKQYKENNDLKVLLLLENDGQSEQEEKVRDSAIRFSAEHSFTLYIAPSNYIVAVNEEWEPAEMGGQVQEEEENEEHIAEDVEELDREHIDEGSEEETIHSPFEEYYHVLMQQLKWMKEHTVPIQFERMIKGYLTSSLPDQYHYAIATLLIEVYEKNGEKEKLKLFLTELVDRYPHHPFLSNLLESYLSQ